MDPASHIFWLKCPFDLQSNEDTLDASFWGSRYSSRELFFEYYDSIRDWVREHEGSGLGIIALDENDIQARGYLSAYANRLNSGVVGRHENADVFLGGDPRLSLRHLAVLVAPARRRTAPRVRVIDLRSSQGFTDGWGTRIRSCESDRPFLIRCGRYSVLFVPASRSRRDRDWPREPGEVWERLRRRDAFTLDTAHPATLDDPLLFRNEVVLGELVISSENGRGTIRVGQRAARSGILLGRSVRCDADALLRNPHISRVHALIVEMAGRLYAIDTASKNGVWGKRGEERAKLLESRTTFSLCGLATVEWRFLH